MSETDSHESLPAGRLTEVVFCEVMFWVPVALVVVPVELFDAVMFVFVPPPLEVAPTTAASVELREGSTKFPPIFWMNA